MGSFRGHVIPGSLFLLIGLWHIWCTAVRYVSGPSSFRVRVWNPVGTGRILRHLELFVVTGGAFFDMCVELLYSTHLKWFVGPDRVLNPNHLNDFEHGGMLLMFFLFGAIALLSEKTRYLPSTDEVLWLLVAAAFSAEYVLFYFHSTSHTGLEGYYHFLLVILVGLCIASTIAGALFPSSLAVDLSSGIAITLQGTWFYQTAFTLYGPMMPLGCRLDGNDIICKKHGALARGEHFANLQFFALFFLVFVYSLGCYAVAASKFPHPELRKQNAAEFIGAHEGNEDGLEMIAH